MQFLFCVSSVVHVGTQLMPMSVLTLPDVGVVLTFMPCFHCSVAVSSVQASSHAPQSTELVARVDCLDY